MVVVVITGGIGAGKSLASACFRERGAVVIDLDEIAHRVIEPGGPAADALTAAFGASVLDADGRVDRSTLARHAFASAAATAKLNAITHPVIVRECERQIAELRRQVPRPEIVVVEVPLLAEAPEFARIADVVLAVSADPELRVARATAAGWDEDDVRARLARQATDAEREALADHVIVNEGTRNEFITQVEAFAADLEARGEA